MWLCSHWWTRCKSNASHYGLVSQCLCIQHFSILAINWAITTSNVKMVFNGDGNVYYYPWTKKVGEKEAVSFWERERLHRQNYDWWYDASIALMFFMDLEKTVIKNRTTAQKSCAQSCLFGINWFVWCIAILWADWYSWICFFVDFSNQISWGIFH